MQNPSELNTDLPIGPVMVIDHRAKKEYFLSESIDVHRYDLSVCTVVPWERRHGNHSVFNKHTREIRWLFKPDDPTPLGLIMISALGTYDLLPCEIPFYVNQPPSPSPSPSVPNNN